jgi:hypothetical protein
MTPYYDVFNAEEEEDFLETETAKCRQNLRSLLGQLRLQDPRLTDISLDFGLGKCDLSNLCDALRDSNRLERLKISNWPMGDKGANCLGDAIASPGCHIRELSLRTCGIQGAGAVSIFGALEFNSSLVKLDLSRNNLRFGLVNISEAFEFSIPRMSGLRELDVSFACLDSTSLRSLLIGVQSNTRLSVLNVTGNMGGIWTAIDVAVDCIPKCQYIERLILTNGAEALIQTNGTMHALRLLNNLLGRLGDNIRHAPGLFDLGSLSLSAVVGCTLLEKQRLHLECHSQIRLIHYLLDCNRIKSEGILCCERPELLPQILERTNRMRCSRDVLFFVLREKAHCIVQASRR